MRIASGWGTHGGRTGPRESDQNFKMILIVSEPVAQVLLKEIERTLQKRCAMTAFQHGVAVLNSHAGVVRLESALTSARLEHDGG